MTKRLLALIFLSAATFALNAAENVTAAAGYAFPSTQEGGTARAIALGSTYVGIAEGSASLLWNPAGLGTLLCPEIALHHNSGLVGAIQEIAVLGLPMGLGNGLGLSLNYEDNGSFDGRDSIGAVTSSYGARAFGGSLGWGFGGPMGLYMGAALKANHRDLAGTPSDSIAADLGALWQILPQLSLGAAYTNLGPEVSNRQLAQGLRVGLSTYIGKGSMNQALIALSGESLTYGDQSVHLGYEQTIQKFLALRAGYAVNVQTPATQAILGWTFGGGVIFNSLSLDYAFVPLADLGNMQRVSLTYGFGHCNDAVTPTPSPTPARTASPTPVAKTPTPSPVPTPVAKVPAPVENAVMFTDKDFRYTHPNAKVEDESEAMTDAARQRLDDGLKHLAENPGTTMRVFGNTKVLPEPDEPKEKDLEAKEIGSRRSVLVRDYLVKHAPASRNVHAIVTKGTNTLAPEGVFQVVVR